MSERNALKATAVIVGLLVMLVVPPLTVIALPPCGFFIIGNSYLTEQTSQIGYSTSTTSLDSIVASLSTEAWVYIDDIYSGYGLPQRWDHGVTATMQWGSAPKQAGYWEIYGYHNGQIDCDACGVTHHLTDTSHAARTVSARDAGVNGDGTFALTAQERSLSKTYTEAVQVESSFVYYPLYERIRNELWGSNLDRQVMHYVRPAAGFLEEGDTKPLVFCSNEEYTAKVVVGKADGSYLVITVDLLDDTWTSRSVSGD